MKTTGGRLPNGNVGAGPIENVLASAQDVTPLEIVNDVGQVMKPGLR